jgi:hypothetical protein
MSSVEKLREHAKEVREQAHREADPMTKARLHKIANNLEEAANELERHQDRRS